MFDKNKNPDLGVDASTLGSIDDKMNYNLNERLNIDFVKFGNYDNTIVDISIRVPFRSIHIIYLVPLQVLKAYWAILFRNPHIIGKHEYTSYLDAEKEHVDEINEFMPVSKIDIDKKFPHILPDDATLKPDTKKYYYTESIQENK